MPHKPLRLLHVSTTKISLLLEGMVLGRLGAVLGEEEIARLEIKTVPTVKNSSRGNKVAC